MPKHLEAVHIRHHNVQEHYIGFLLFEDAEPVRAVLGFYNHEAGLHQEAVRIEGVLSGVIVHNQHQTRFCLNSLFFC
ncbi:MAG: hypothetical protein WAN11_12890 [Syntrophobacteraceae bacterium]